LFTIFVVVTVLFVVLVLLVLCRWICRDRKIETSRISRFVVCCLLFGICCLSLFCLVFLLSFVLYSFCVLFSIIITKKKTGRVVLVGREKHLPYDRTKLSKQMESTADKIAMKPASFYEQAKVCLFVRLIFIL
jgi:hypothetical protein